MSRPWSSRPPNPPASFVRINGKIRAREVRVVDENGAQVGIVQLGEAIQMARARGLDLVEVAPQARPPVCRLVDYGKYRYEQSKKQKETRKHQHANRVKEIQLRPAIDPHDLSTKLGHAIDFLCEEMKVKLTLRFRGREMVHKEIGFQVVRKFLDDLNPYGHPDSDPKLVGRGINVMISPLPRNKRAPNPNEKAQGTAPDQPHRTDQESSPSDLASESPSGFVNNPFASVKTESS